MIIIVVLVLTLAQFQIHSEMDIKDPYEYHKIPSYMLVEATGDSEVDSNDPTFDEFGYEIGCADDDDDDAQSCCHDNAAEFKGYESLNDEDDDEDVKKKKQKGNVHGDSYCEDDEMQEENNYKSFVSDDSSSDQEFVDEKEKNRLFWEACLAS